MRYFIGCFILVVCGILSDLVTNHMRSWRDEYAYIPLHRVQRINNAERSKLSIVVFIKWKLFTSDISSIVAGVGTSHSILSHKCFILENIYSIRLSTYEASLNVSAFLLNC